MRIFTLETVTIAMILAYGGCQEISVFPSSSQFVAVNSSVNITFSCNISVPDGNSMDTSAVWVISNRQINVADVPIFASVGVFIELLNQTMISITFTRESRQTFGDTLSLMCAASTPGPPPIINFSPLLSVTSFGRPDPPGRPQVSGSNPTTLSWGRPGNIPDGPVVNYTIVANSTSLDVVMTYVVVGMTQLVLQDLERLALNDSGECQRFTFTVVAGLEDVPNSDPISTDDTIPLSTDVGPINTSLQVNSLTLNSGANTISAGLFFKAAETCNTNFPLVNYTVFVAGRRVGTFPAPPGDLVNLRFTESLQLNQQFMVAVVACTDIICRTSNTTTLNTTDVQTAVVIFFENNIFLSCSFASGSVAFGCEFQFQVNLNGTSEGLEEFVVERSGVHGSLCSASSNQRNGYMTISVLDLEQDRMTRGSVALTPGEQVLETEADYMQQTGCSVQRVVEVDRTAVAIAVPLLLVFAIAMVVTASLIYYFFYYKQRKHIKDIEERKPEMKVMDGDLDTLILDIQSNHDQIIKEPMLDSIKPCQSLPHNMSVQMDGSLKATRPIEVELHRDVIRFKVNKTALKAAARFHSLVKKKHSDTSIDPEDTVSLMALSQAPSLVHFKEDFTSMCKELLPVKEVKDDEDDLRSWALLHYNQPFPTVTPPTSFSLDSPTNGGHDTVDSVKDTRF